ncbi:MAG: patatin-like phospholipase family protein [Castellaniella sp.]|uniref:patatin-like phospholipase family protein n=1 Tax=Castellaniella sp. TaxID=1955812 RepID=UPI002A3670E5|nr:patatin-like phospholipase family protein [Castellaniella sp.]MDY0308899.1 patatin-like phospholipase family protein [Castellaniella sp.]
MRASRPRIGLALGSGSARGWSHIGVIRILEQAGIVPDIVCGTSIGALVGAAYADGHLEKFETWVRGLTWQGVMGLLDFTVSGGLIPGEKLFSFLRAHLDDKTIDSLPRAYGAVATELATGREIWLREGSVIDAVRASAALPGLFTPARREGELLVDGALVNPVPVSLCRAMGADIVIAVDLNSDLIGRRLRPDDAPAASAAAPGALAAVLGKLPLGLGGARGGAPVSPDMPSIFDVLSMSLNIMQVRITRSRLAGEPADVLIRPRLADFALMDYHRAAVAIDAGERAARRALPELRDLIDRVRADPGL